MPPNNFDPELTSVDPALGDHRCPKCGAEMEPIETPADVPRFQQLQLCPGCYLVIWSDQDGLHLRQGVPMNTAANPDSAPSWLAGEPKDC